MQASVNAAVMHSVQRCRPAAYSTVLPNPISFSSLSASGYSISGLSPAKDQALLRLMNLILLILKSSGSQLSH